MELGARGGGGGRLRGGVQVGASLGRVIKQARHEYRKGKLPKKAAYKTYLNKAGPWPGAWVGPEGVPWGAVGLGGPGGGGWVRAGPRGPEGAREALRGQPGGRGGAAWSQGMPGKARGPGVPMRGGWPEAGGRGGAPVRGYKTCSPCIKKGDATKKAASKTDLHKAGPRAGRQGDLGGGWAREEPGRPGEGRARGVGGWTFQITCVGEKVSPHPRMLAWGPAFRVQ